MTGPIMPKTAQPAALNKKKEWQTTVILLLLIAVAVLVVLSVKKFIEVGRPVTPQELTIKEYTKVVNDSPGNIQARTALGYEFQKNGQYDEAREQYQEVLKVDPENQAAKYNLGVVLEATQDVKEAEKTYKELLAKFPGHVLGSYSLGNLYINSKKYDEALKVVDNILKYKDAKTKVEFYLLAGKAYEGKGDKAKAKEAFNKVLQFIPDDKDALAAIKRLK